MNKILKLYSIGILLFLYTPIMLLILNSFNENRYSNEFIGFSLVWYRKLFTEQTLIIALKNSLLIATIASAFSTFIAILLSYSIYKYNFAFKNTVNVVINTILIMPDISLAIGMMFLFQVLKFSLGLNTIITAHITFGIAYATTVLSTNLSTLDVNIQDAARDLGASEWQTIKMIILPILKSSIIAAFFVCFTLSWDDFVFSFFNSGAGTSTLPVQISVLIKKGVSPQINAISTISMLISFVVIYIGFKGQKILINS
jgi:spermidine/putrescine transport system permease protein